MTTSPTALRNAGMRAAEDHADVRRVLMVDRLIQKAIQQGHPFSANDIRWFLPVVSRGLVGARMNSFAARRPAVMVKVGEEPSMLPSTHGKPIAIWRGIRASDLTATEQAS